MKNILHFFLGVATCAYGNLFVPRRQQESFEENEPEELQDLEKVAVCLAMGSGENKRLCRVNK